MKPSTYREYTIDRRKSSPGSNLSNSDLAQINAQHIGVLMEAEVLDYDASFDLTRVKISDNQLYIPGHIGSPNCKLRLHILASDVSLCKTCPQDSSILNIVPVTIDTIESGDFAKINLVAGKDKLIAHISRRSCTTLGLEPGLHLYAQLKSIAIKSSLVN